LRPTHSAKNEEWVGRGILKLLGRINNTLDLQPFRPSAAELVEELNPMPFASPFRILIQAGSRLSSALNWPTWRPASWAAMSAFGSAAP
jgi:hypothetical protein